MAKSPKSIPVETWVGCPVCACEIPVDSAHRLPREFSVQCPNCGGRSVYQLSQLHEERTATAATRIVERISFGKRT
jgi:hypothetical protein